MFNAALVKVMLIDDQFVINRDLVLRAELEWHPELLLPMTAHPKSEYPTDAEPLVVKTSIPNYGGVSARYNPWNALDGDDTTFWHPGGYSDGDNPISLPYDFDIMFLEPTLLKSFAYSMPLPELGNQYCMKDFDLLGSMGKDQKWVLLGSYTCLHQHSTTFEFNFNAKCKFYRLHIRSKYEDSLTHPYPALVAGNFALEVGA